ncbi:MAG: NAD(P)-dependent oxidoreductase [Dissulfurispiraceae bacterium]
MRAGFIGLGNLGRAMAKRLISEGVDLIVWNRTKDKVSDLGAGVATSPAHLFSQVHLVFLSLFDSEAVKAVMSGEKGFLKGDCKGKIIIDTSTNHFDSVTAFHEIIKEHGASYLESPVLGSVVPAQQGNLTVLVSGERNAFEKALPFLKIIGNNIFFVEKQALATKMKLINNLVLGCFMATIAEALTLGEDVGLEKKLVLEILAAGAGSSTVLNANREKLINDDFTTQFSTALIYKDLHYLQDLARNLRRPLFTGSVVKELFAMALTKDSENLDFSVLYKVLRDFI